MQSDLPKIGNPATNALHAVGITRLEQLAKVTETYLFNLHGVGPKAVRILKETMKEKGLAFAKA